MHIGFDFVTRNGNYLDNNIITVKPKSTFSFDNSKAQNEFAHLYLGSGIKAQK